MSHGASEGCASRGEEVDVSVLTPPRHAACRALLAGLLHSTLSSDLSQSVTSSTPFHHCKSKVFIIANMLSVKVSGGKIISRKCDYQS